MSTAPPGDVLVSSTEGSYGGSGIGFDDWLSTRSGESRATGIPTELIQPPSVRRVSGALR
jgi:hypothetical protein